MANLITITGALGRAPSLNFTQAGKPAWGFPLGFTPSRKTDNGWEDTGPTLWFDVTAWGEDAEDLARRYDGVERGRATVTGRIASRTWTNKEGAEVTQMTITADAVTIHPPKQQQGGSSSWGGNQSSSQQAQQPPAGGQQDGQQPDPWSPPGGGGSIPAGTGSYDEPPFEA